MGPTIPVGRLLKGHYMAVESNAALTILRRKQVEARTGLSRSTIYLRISEGTFPTPIHLGAKSVGWLAHEVDCWLERRVAESRGDAR